MLMPQIVERVRQASPDTRTEAERIALEWVRQNGKEKEWQEYFPATLDATSQVKQLLDDVAEISRTFGFELMPWHGFLAPRVVVLRFRLAPKTDVVKVRAKFDNVVARCPGMGVEPPPVIRIIEGGIEILTARKEWEVCHLAKYVGFSRSWKPWEPLVMPLGVSVEGALINQEIIHARVVGESGGGKTAFMNAFLGSVPQLYTADQVQWLLIDPEVVGLQGFRDLAWFWRGVDGKLASKPIVDVGDAIKALGSILIEHEKRLKKFVGAGVDSIGKYNRRSERPMPHLLVVVDEYAVLLNRAGIALNAELPEPDQEKSKAKSMKEGKAIVENIVIEISQRCRKTGIHLVLASQRAAADTFDPNLRDNLGTKIILRCNSEGGSRVAFGTDCDWAMNLSGNGDAWISSAVGILRSQSLYIDNEIVLSDGKTRLERLLEAARNADH